MHSIKNTVVAVFLLGVTYTVYQSISTPEPVHVDAGLLELSVDDNLQPLQTGATNLFNDAKKSVSGFASDLSGKATESVNGFANELSKKTGSVNNLSLIHI